MKRGLAIFFFITCTLVTFILVTQAKQTESLLVNNAKAVFDLNEHWKLGNVVSLIRHTERCDRSENPCFGGKEGITEQGVENAIAVGKAYKNLPDHPTVIYHSPMLRTVQSANFMFGNKSEEKKWLRHGCKKNLFNDILKHKENGINLILITHSTCVDRLGQKEGEKLIELDIHNKETYGGSFFLTVDKKSGNIHVLGYLYLKDWEKAYQ